MSSSAGLPPLRRVAQRKTLYATLLGIKGVGQRQAKFVCAKARIHPMFPMAKMQQWQQDLVNTILRRDHCIFEEHDNAEAYGIARQILQGTSRGFYHWKGLPVRGQKNVSNAKTARKLNSQRVAWMKKLITEHMRGEDLFANREKPDVLVGGVKFIGRVRQ
ncbi:MAG: hypothetical protein MHM6MM_007802 [Cercozoa sp. M6MM]